MPRTGRRRTVRARAAGRRPPSSTRPGIDRAGWDAGLLAALALRPGLDREAPEPDEAGGILVAEGVVGFVRGQRVVVEAPLGATSGHEAASRLEPQPHLSRDVALGRVDER